MLREQSPLGLAPLLGAWLRGDFSGPFFWPYFINNIPPVKTHWCQKIGAVGLNSPVMGAPWSGLASLPGSRLSHPDSPVV